VKAADFAALLQRYAESGMAPGDSARLNELSSAFAQAGGRTVAAVLKSAGGGSAAALTRPSNDGTAGALRRLAVLVGPIAKAGIAKDIDAVANVVQRLGDAETIAALSTPTHSPRARTAIRAADPEVVSRTVAGLTAALGNADAFGAAYQRMIDTASTKEIVAIARAFTPGTVKSAADAKRKILNRQQALAGVAAKSRATSGRSAA
jgi:hypothetical protein